MSGQTFRDISVRSRWWTDWQIKYVIHSATKAKKVMWKETVNTTRIKLSGSWNSSSSYKDNRSVTSHFYNTWHFCCSHITGEPSHPSDEIPHFHSRQSQTTAVRVRRRYWDCSTQTDVLGFANQHGPHRAHSAWLGGLRDHNTVCRMELRWRDDSKDSQWVLRLHDCKWRSIFCSEGFCLTRN